MCTMTDSGVRAKIAIPTDKENKFIVARSKKGIELYLYSKSACTFHAYKPLYAIHVKPR